MTSAPAAAGFGLPYLDARDDLPHQPPPDVPGWVENYLIHAYFPEAGVGLWSHLGGVPHDPALWRETLVLALPGGRFAMAKGYAPSRVTDGASSARLSYTCREPFRRWLVRFEGVARVVPAHDLRAAALADGPGERVSLEFELTALSPAFDFGEHLASQHWASTHYEQHFTATGSLRVGDERFALDGHGLRDHSTGPRHLRDLRRHCWVHGRFPSGRAFQVFHAESVGSDVMSCCVIDEPDGRRRRMHLAGPAPLLADRPDLEGGYRLRFEDDRGDPVVIDGQPLTTATLSILEPWDMALGGYRGPGLLHHLFEGMTRFRCGDEVGHGLTERTVRHADPAPR
jgi:hypothetical protein